MKKHIIILLIFLLGIVNVQAQQKFFNLTSDDVKIDTLLPSVGYCVELPKNHNDTVYSVTLKYPEYIDMTRKDIEAYQRIAGTQLPAAIPEIETFITRSRKVSFLSSSLCPIAFVDGKYKWLVSFMLQVKASPKKPTATGELSLTPQLLKTEKPVSSRYAAHSILSKGTWAKIKVEKNGIHHLTQDVIKSAGFSDLNKVKIYGYGGNLVPEKLTDSYLRDYDDIKEVPSCMVNGRRLFYAKGPVSWESNKSTMRIRNPYSDYGYYFITQTEDEPLLCTEEELLNIALEGTERYHSLHEKDEFSWYEGGRNLVERTKITSAGRTFTLPVPEGNSEATLTAVVTSGAAITYQVLCNDSLLFTQELKTVDYDKGASATKSCRIISPKAENNITVKVIEGTEARLDYLQFQYSVPQKAPDLAADVFPAAQYVYRITTQDLHADAGYDMVIIMPTSQKHLAQVNRLAQHHRDKDGLKVRVLPADEIFNEFSSGTPDASAYRRYMKMLYDKAGEGVSAPRYLLLFGDGSFDNRMLTPGLSDFNPDDFLLCYESENSLNTINCYVSEDFFVMLDDEETIETGTRFMGIPDVAVGRFPVRTEHEAKTLVDKTINYATNKTRGKWQNVLAFLGDDGNENLHMDDVNKVADQVINNHPGYEVKKVMWDAFPRVTNSNGNHFPEATALIKKLQNDGVLVIDYAGHANESTMSDEHVLDIKDMPAFRGANLPLWVAACCDIAPFDSSTDNIGESVLLNDKGGALAFFGTARTVMAGSNYYMNREYINNVLSYGDDGKPLTIGEAARKAKETLVNKALDRSVNKIQYMLLGDPALSLALPELSVEIDEVNDISDFSSDVVELKSAEVVKVKGHLKRGNDKATDFNGLLNAMVRNSLMKITCHLANTSDVGASKPFEYYDRPQTLFLGKDSVRNGEFEFVFAVPADAREDGGTGLMTFYALSSDHQSSANGEFGNFVLKKGAETERDNVGPTIYCYLNNPSFEYGGTVNSTPFFVAEISDKDGINTSGTGLGHNLTLTIDNDYNRYYNLNDNFQYDFGSYTSGQTYYSLPELKEGRHTLTFHAWDVLNNPSTVQLVFNVEKGLRPNISDVSVSKNPARDNTTFIVTHNRPNAAVSMQIEVMDASGRLIWSHNENGTSSGSNFTYDWNLTLDNGQKLQTGIYLYRINLSCDGSQWTSKAKKLIVIGSK